MIIIIMIILSNQLSMILNEFITHTGQLCYPLSFSIMCKDILYGPKLNTLIFSDPTLCTNNNFENVNLGRFYNDRINYNKYNYSNSVSVSVSESESEIKTIEHIFSNNLSNNFKVDNPNILITKNEYPYIIPNTNYDYWIIWNLQNSNIQFEQILNYFDLVNKDYILWKNNELYKSIKYIEHYHIILRNSIPKLKLKKLLILQRHGPREPLSIPNKFISTYWNTVHLDIDKAINGAKLTDLGKLYCKYIGELFLDNYSNDFNFSTLNKSNILFGSSNFQRTIDTSVLTLDGLKLSNLDLDLEILKFLSTDAIFTPEQKQIYNHKMENNDIKFDLDLTEFNKKIFDLTGFEIKKFRDYFELASTIKCYTFHNYKMLSNDEANLELMKIKNTIYYLSTYYYNMVNDMSNSYFEENKLIGKTVIDNMIKLWEDSEYKFMLFTSHDNLLMPTIKYLVYGILNNLITFKNMTINKEFYTQDILSKINYMDFPEFNSSIRFELWEDNFYNKKIRIYYCSLMLFEFKQI